jgi:HrpA-like RNA helicase
MPNILVFLPSIPEIKLVQEKIISDLEFQKIKETTNFQIEEFHGGLTPQQKNEVLDPKSDMSNISRVILATNIAETAVTIPNIVYVLDSGLEREFYEDEVTCQTTERIVAISKSSVAQRQGRAGRISNGFSYKMYSQEEFSLFEDAKKPELIRMDIADVVLQSIALSEFFEISDVMFYSKIEAKVEKVLKLLLKLGCYVESDDEQKLTRKGEFIVKSSLGVKHAAFLYENLMMDNEKFGFIATAILSKTAGYFREREALQNVVDHYIHKGSISFKNLGDLAPLIYLADEYDFKDVEKVQKFEQLKVKKQEMSMFLKDIDKIQREANKLKEYVDDADLENIQYKYLKPEEKLQLAFVKSYPSNICVIADGSKQYPYYLLVESRELMKVHGSSIMARSMQKPEWMCCQNIVVSSITQREMTKVVVPIYEKMFRHFQIQDFIDAQVITNQIVTQREVIEQVPTALLKFFRRKNKIEHFRNKFRENKVYLETEEEQEKVLYFYLTDYNNEEADRAKVLELHKEIVDYSTTALKKRHALVKISERTKFQVDENCKIVDILSNSEYLGILVKNCSPETQKILHETKVELEIDDRDINIDIDKEKDIMFVFLLNKHKAREYYEHLNGILSAKKPPIKCKYT